MGSSAVVKQKRKHSKMKKLMVAAFAVAFAAIANAGTFAWNISNIAAYGDDATSDGYQAWVIENFVGDITADNYTDVIANYGKISAWTDPSEPGAYQGSTNGSSKEHGLGETVNARVLVIDAFLLDDATAFWVGENKTTESDNSMGAFNPGTLTWDASATSSKDAWTSTSAVPEPTSGLLLLLGVAGLALRRRRA